MHTRNLTRFLLLTLLMGSVFGLIAGLAFGGPEGGPVARQSAQEAQATGVAASSQAEATAIDTPMTSQKAKEIGANEMGLVPVLMYHKIGTPESTWTRTPEHFREDIAALKAEGFYPINLRDLASGDIDIPAGKSPVVLTFDDSSIGQYRLLDDGSLDPECAVGIMQEAVEAGGWASKATFFCLIEVDVADRRIFGQDDLREQKVRQLISWGYEIGSHTVTHLDLSKATTEEATKQLALSKSYLENLIGGGYRVTSLSIPFGAYPKDDSVLAGGEWEGTSYAYTAAVEVSGGSSFAPFSTRFEPLHIARIQVTGTALRDMLNLFREKPELRYVSDGDPMAVSAPRELASKLGELRSDLGRPLVRY